MEYGINCSTAQMRKLKSGGAVTLKPNNFVDEGVHRIRVMPNTSRRINTAMKKNKGIRIALKPEEDIVAMTEGGAFSLKSIGDFAKKAVKTVGKAAKSVAKTASKDFNIVKKGFKKEIIDSGVGKEIIKNAIDVGTEVLLPAGLSAASMFAGDPTGLSGAAAGKVAGNYLQKAAKKAGYGILMAEGNVEGAGVFQFLHKLGIRKKSVLNFARSAGKVLANEGAKAAGIAITAYTGNPAAGMAFERIASSAANAALDSKKGKDIIKNAGKGALKTAKKVAVEGIDDYIDKNLTGNEKRIAEGALAGKYPSAKDLIYDVGKSKIEEMGGAFGGYGIPRKTRGGLRLGKGIANITPAYNTAMRSVRLGGGGFKVADDRFITEAPTLSVIQTGSPFARYSSAAMSPFIASSPQLAGGISRGGSFNTAGGSFLTAGGSFSPAGTSGGSFNPSGGR